MLKRYDIYSGSGFVDSLQAKNGYVALKMFRYKMGFDRKCQIVKNDETWKLITPFDIFYAVHEVEV